MPDPAELRLLADVLKLGHLTSKSSSIRPITIVRAGQARIPQYKSARQPAAPMADFTQPYKRQQRSAPGAMEQLHETIAAENDLSLLELALVMRKRTQPLREFLLRSIHDAENYERQASN